MKYLLDTHAFLWFLNGDESLSKNARKHIDKDDTVGVISIVSIWEIAIKIKLKKLKIDMPFENLKEHLFLNGWDILPITFEDTHKISCLGDPLPGHCDPFDRLIIAQCMTHNIPIITKDPAFKSYGVEIIW